MRNFEEEYVSNKPSGHTPQRQAQPPESHQNCDHSTALPPSHGAHESASGPPYLQYPGVANGSAPSQAGSMAPNIAAMLSYLLGWIGGLIMYLTQRDREVRFHAMQSILTFGGLNIIYWGAWTILWGVDLMNFFAGSFLLTTFFYWLFSLLSFALWIFLGVQGYQLKHTKLPVVGAIAERWTTK
jgi:uncharacterized membrane protein